ncbi:MAG TPA: glycosyltransferase family 39 protein [Acetobacteraceae bacterium]|nr:glycosyltransferase family 39 protein [Acetobacteraceae bacterium]
MLLPASPRTRFIGATALVIAIAVMARAFELGSQSLWTDELFTRYYPSLFSLKFLWTTGLFHENSPPLYYIAIKAWMALFGSSETALRSLSLLASVLTLPLVYLLAMELFHQRRHGLLAMLAFSLLPMQIGFAQEARTYALLLIPLCGALLAIARMLRGDWQWQTAVLYGFCATAALYCHVIAAFFLVACNIVVIAATARHQRQAWRRWVAINALVFVLTIPELMAILGEGRSGSGISWIPPFRPVDVVRALSPVVVGSATPDKVPGAELALLLLAVLAVRQILVPSARSTLLVLLAIPCIYVLLIATASLLHPIFIARMFCWLDLPLALLLADAIATPWRYRSVAAGMACAAIGTGLGYQYTTIHNEPWRSIFHQIGPQLAHADEVVLAPLTDPTTIAYYAPYLGHPRMLDTAPHGNVENGLMPDRMNVHWVTPAQVIDRVHSGAEVWLIMRPPDAPYVGSLLTELPPPSTRIARSCDKVICIMALAWSRHATPASTGFDVR